MAEFDAAGFVAQMEAMGVKLTATPLADGRYRVNRWRMMGSHEHAAQIRALWDLHLSNNYAHMQKLGEYLFKPGPSVIANRVARRFAAG